MAQTLSNFDALLKEYYTTEKIHDLTYRDFPFFAMLDKTENFVGDVMPIPVVYGNSQGRSATFATAQTNSGNVPSAKFLLTRVSDYEVLTIDNEVIEASKGNEGAFLEAEQSEIDGGFNALTHSLATALMRNGSGSIGQISNASPTTSITLSDTDDIVNFEVGMVLQVSTADGTGSLKTGTTAVTDVNRNTGVLTVATSLATFTAAGAAADYIFVQGDHAAKVSGLEAWIPSSDPSATTFFGVDRTADITRLSGLRYDGSSLSIEEALIVAIAKQCREGGRPDVCFLNYTYWSQLEKELHSRLTRVMVTVTGRDVPEGINFPAIRLNGPKGPVDVIADQTVKGAVAWLLQMNTWKWYGLGMTPRIETGDGLSKLRRSAADGIEIRMKYYGNLGCRAPGYNMRVTLPSA